MTTTPLPRLTLAERVRDYVVLEITQGRIEPGTPLRELEIAELLGTSQTPVREAFRELIALGLLESKAHVGTRVRAVAEQDLLDAVPVRAALEGIAGRLAAPHLAGNTTGLRAAFDTMREVAASGDRLAYAIASTEFHRAIIAAAHNRSLQRAWNSLGIEVMTIMSTGSTTIALVDAAESHRGIVEALEAGDASAAERALSGHVASYLPETPHTA